MVDQEHRPPMLEGKRWVERHLPRLSSISRRLLWAVHPEAIRSRISLGKLQELHRGERCFVVGNGPSLNQMDLSLLHGEATFTLNRGYLLFDRMGKPSPYHVVVNPYVLDQWRSEILDLPSQVFMPWGRRHGISRSREVTFIGGPAEDMPPRFSRDVREDLWTGATVTYVAIQLAYFMGFQKVILIGVDHRFKTQGPANQLVVSEGPDQDHFDPDYFGKGTQWQLPDLETSELAYMLARFYFHAAGRRIVDATVDGALTVFPKVGYQDLF